MGNVHLAVVFYGAHVGQHVVAEGAHLFQRFLHQAALRGVIVFFLGVQGGFHPGSVRSRETVVQVKDSVGCSRRESKDKWAEGAKLLGADERKDGATNHPTIAPDPYVLN